jgi:hypothetical protein
MRLACTAALALSLLALPGCLVVGGPDKTMPPTLGQELLDLKTAHEEGALTADEYEQARKRLLTQGSSLTRQY